MKGSHVLWVASKPTKEEYLYGKLISGEIGQVIRKEFLLQTKVDPLTFSRVSLWLHPIEIATNDNCFNIGMRTVTEFARNASVVILVGTEAVSQFTSLKVSDVTGLDVKSECRDFPNAKHVFAMVSPGIAFSKGIGEIRFAINQIKEYLHE